MPRLVVVVRSSEVNPRRTRSLLRWAQQLVPAAVIVATTGDSSIGDAREDAIRIDAEDIPSGPLSLANALARAASSGPPRERRFGSPLAIAAR